MLLKPIEFNNLLEKRIKSYFGQISFSLLILYLSVHLYQFISIYHLCPDQKINILYGKS